MRAALRRLFTQEVAVALLLVTALLSLPLALRREAPDAAFTLLVPVSIVGAAGGFVLYGSKLRERHAPALFTALGAAVLFIRIGQVGGALGAAARETLRMVVVLLMPAQEPGSTVVTIASWMAAQGEAWAQASAFAQRAAGWLTSIAQGLMSDDPPARALWLGMGLWLLAIWASRRLRLNDDPLGGLLPTTALLAVTLARTVQNRWPLWLHLGALLVLVSITHLGSLIRSWREARTDYSDSVREDSLLSGFLLIVVILSASFAASTFSLDDLLDKFRHEQPAAATSNDASGSRRASSGAVPSGAAGLQSAHIIRAGPELSADVVMYISTGDLPPLPPSVQGQSPHYYWREETYQTYNGRAWSNLMHSDFRLAGQTQIMEAGSETYRRVHATVEIPGGASGAMYWTGTLMGADMPLEVAWRPGTGSDPANAATNAPPNLDLIGAVAVEDEAGPRQSYTFDALLPDITEEQLQAAPAAYPPWVMERYALLPDTVPERVRALARDLTVQGRTPYERAVAIERYLRQIPYSLDVPAPPSARDAVDYFLFDLKKGYCDYYATAMAVLARAAGLPARLVTGYASGSYDSYSATYVIREQDAHSWTEVYFTGIGWVEFEPTPGQPLPGRETVQGTPALKPMLPAAKPKWYILPSVDPARYKEASWAVPILAALYGSWLLIDMLRLRWMSPDAATEHLYRRLQRATRHMGHTAFAGETAREHVALVMSRLSMLSAGSRAISRFAEPAQKAMVALTDLYMLSLFGPAPLGSAQRAEAIRMWVGLRWRLALVKTLLALRRSDAPSRPPENEGGQSRTADTARARHWWQA